MTSTINGINSVVDELDRLHGILADDVAELQQLDPATSAPAIAEKQRVASMLESTRRELDALKASQNKWARETLKLP